MTDSYPVIDDAKRIRQPILYVGGEDSAEYFQEVRAPLSSWFPRMKELIIPKTTHMLHMMNPKPVAGGLADFFSKHPVQ